MIPPTLMTARRRRCALAAIAVCLGSSIAAVGPAQAAPAAGAQVPAAVQAAAGDDVTPTSHPIALENVFREDVPAGMLTQEEALDQAPDSEDGQFKVPAILDGE